MTGTTASATTAARPPRVPIYPILAVNFVGTLGFSIVLPFLVYLVTRLGGNALIYGLMGATFSLFQFVGAPILGRWSDRVGRKRILLLSQLGTLASWGVFLVALALPTTPLRHVDSTTLGAFTITVPLVVLFLARALDGITGGNISVANAYLADITTDANRTANYGRMAVSGNLGFVVGPALAGLLGATAMKETAPVLAALVISGIACAMILIGLPESHPVRCVPPGPLAVRRMLGQECHEHPLAPATPQPGFTTVLRLPSIALLLGLQFLVYLAFNLFYVAFPVYVAHDLQWTLASTGMFFSVLSLVMVLAQGPLLSRASRMWSDRTLAIAGSVILASSFVVLTSRTMPVIYAGGALLAVGNGLMWPSLLAILSRSAGRDVQGAVQGLAGSGGAVASIAGLLAGGVLFGFIGSAVFGIAAALAALVAALGLWIPRAPVAPAA